MKYHNKYFYVLFISNICINLFLGELVDDDNIQNIHYGGTITKHINKNKILTRKGVYVLIGPPIPKNKLSKMFYEFWTNFGGFPKRFYCFLKKKKRM